MGRQQGQLGQTSARAAALQAVVIELLDDRGGQPEHVVHQHLRSRLRQRGLPLPPEAWLLTVAGEISADRLYVVAQNSLPRDYSQHPAARRATARVSGGNSAEPA